MALVIQLYAPLEFDRSLYVFCCNTRRCSLSSAGWMVVRNQTQSTQPPGAPVPDARPPAAVIDPPKSSSAWDDFAFDEEEDGSVDDLNQLLEMRDLTLVDTQAATKATSSKQQGGTEADHFATSVCLPCWDIAEEEECWGEEDEAAARDGVSAGDEHAGAGQSEHIDRLLRSYYEGEEDTSIVDLVKKHTSGGAAKPGAEPGADIDEEPAESTTSAIGKGRASRVGAGGGNGDADSDDEETAELGLARSSRRQRAEAYFQQRVSYYPSQVLRYAYGGEPLWITHPSPLDETAATASSTGAAVDKQKTPAKAMPGTKASIDRAQSSVVPPCEWCGKRRVFEFQLMPGLLSCISSSTGTPSRDPAHGAGAAGDKCGFSGGGDLGQPSQADLLRLQRDLDSGGMDFGVVAVYSCPDSCAGPAGPTASGGRRFATEIVIVQGPPDIM